MPTPIISMEQAEAAAMKHAQAFKQMRETLSREDKIKKVLELVDRAQAVLDKITPIANTPDSVFAAMIAYPSSDEMKTDTVKKLVADATTLSLARACMIQIKDKFQNCVFSMRGIPMDEMTVEDIESAMKPIYILSYALADKQFGIDVMVDCWNETLERFKTAYPKYISKEAVEAAVLAPTSEEALRAWAAEGASK